MYYMSFGPLPIYLTWGTVFTEARSAKVIMPPRSDIEAMDRPILYYVYNLWYIIWLVHNRRTFLCEMAKHFRIYHSEVDIPYYYNKPRHAWYETIARFLSVRTCISICPLILPTWWYRLVYIRTHHNQGSFLFTALRCSCANAAYKVVQTKVHNCVDGFS